MLKSVGLSMGMGLEESLAPKEILWNHRHELRQEYTLLEGSRVSVYAGAHEFRYLIGHTGLSGV